MAAVLCAAAPAAAQQMDAGPYGNLFKGSGKAQTHSLDLSGGLFGGYDDTPLAQAPNGPDTSFFDPRLQVPGTTSGFHSTASYHYGHAGRGKSSTRFGVGAIASIQEFSGGSSKPLWSPNYGVNTSFGTSLTPKISFSANGGVSYSPYYQYAPFLASTAPLTGAIAPGSVVTEPPADGSSTSDPAGATPIPQPATNVGPVGTDAGFAVQSEFVTRVIASAGLTDRFTKRSSVSLNGSWDRMELSQTRIETRMANLEMSHHLTRKVGVHFGYGLQESRYLDDSAANTPTLNHSIDFGIDYGDGGSISFKRYYTLSFTTGISAVRRASETQLRLDGSAALVRRIGRTWAASIGAARGTSYVLGFREPLFSDSANAGVGGQIAPRLNFSSGAAYMVGQRAFSDSGGNLVSKSASAKLTLGVTTHVGLYGQYSYYRYDVPDGFFSTIAFPQHQHRRSASVGLSFWVPLINQRLARQP